MKPKAIFFAPHAFVWVHAFPEALVADALRAEDFDVHVITCQGELSSWCISMESTGQNESMSAEVRAEICAKCQLNKKLLEDHFAFEQSDLGQYLTAEDHAQIDKDIRSVAPQTILDFKIEGLPVGKTSLYNFNLNYKRMSEDFTADEWAAYLMHFRSALVAFYAGRRILDRHQPDYVFFYNSGYAINLSVRIQCEQRGIKSFSLYNGTNWANGYERIHIAPRDSFKSYENRGPLWDDKFRFLPATDGALASAEALSSTLSEGKHFMVYGGGNSKLNWRTVRARWGINESQKVLLAATSSYDEIKAAQSVGAIPYDLGGAFATQVEWLRALIEFVSRRPDLFLIVRVHPRELPNRREMVQSQHSFELAELLKNLPANVRANWPQDGMSFYDWLDVVDLGLTSWSSVGRDFAAWGLPHVSYMDFGLYPKRQIGFVGNTPDEFFKKIDEALKSGWSAERVYQTYRWIAFETEGSVFDISDVVRPAHYRPRGILRRVFNRITRRRFVERQWLAAHRSPLRQAPLMAERVRTGAHTEEVLEQTRRRLTEANERKRIREIVQGLANVRFGADWTREEDLSELRRSVASFLKQS